MRSPNVKGTLALEGRVRVTIGLHMKLNCHGLLHFFPYLPRRLHELTTSYACQCWAQSVTCLYYVIHASSCVHHADYRVLVGTHVMTQPKLIDLPWNSHPHPERQYDSREGVLTTAISTREALCRMGRTLPPSSYLQHRCDTFSPASIMRCRLLLNNSPPRSLIFSDTDAAQLSF